MMNKKAMVSMILASLISVCALAACRNSGDGTTDTPSGVAVGGASGDQDQQQNGDRDWVDHVADQTLQPDAIYDLGQTVQQIILLPEDEKTVGVEYTVHKAVLFDNAAQAGIAADQMFTGEIFVDPQGNTDLDAWTSYDQENLGFLLCDITLKNVNASVLNISDISLVYAPPGETVREIALPSYFSNPKNRTEYYLYRLGRGNSIEVQVGWQADFSQLNKQDIYLAVNFYGVDTTYIRLDL